MNVIKEHDTGTALARARFHDPWPRLADWFDTLLPADFGWRSELHTMRIEESLKDDVLTIRAELPGMDPDKDIEIRLGDGVLTIEAEREEHKEVEQRSEFFYGKFVRTLSLPPNADESTIRAEYRDGILQITVRMAESASSPSTKVPIERTT